MSDRQPTEGERSEWTVARFTSPDTSPGLLLWQVFLMWRRRVERALQPFRLTHTQFVILAGLGWHSAQKVTVSQKELAAFTRTDLTVMSQVLRALEKRGVVDRLKNLNDERAIHPTLNARGGTLLMQALPAVEKVDAAFFGVLGEEFPAWRDGLAALSVSEPKKRPERISLPAPDKTS
jgi:DNA-binding MarR family transcriptional regulator